MTRRAGNSASPMAMVRAASLSASAEAIYSPTSMLASSPRSPPLRSRRPVQRLSPKNAVPAATDLSASGATAENQESPIVKVPPRRSPPNSVAQAVTSLSPLRVVPARADPSSSGDARAPFLPGAGHVLNDAHRAVVSARHLLALRELYRRRQDFLNAEGALSRQIKRIVSRSTGKRIVTETDVEHFAASYGPLRPLLHMRKEARTHRLVEERAVAKAAKQLPVWSTFGESIAGFGAISLGAIIAEAGDLSRYAGPAKLWKRMGVAVIGNERQRKCLDKEKALEHGYSPRRRSIMFVIGECLVKTKSEYRAVYDARKLYEAARAEELGLIVAPAANIPKGEHARFRSHGHIHLRAKRYMEKRLLRNLWRAWRDHRMTADHAPDVKPGAP